MKKIKILVSGIECICCMLRIFIFLYLIFFTLNANALDDCKWNIKNGTSCLIISKTNNTSKISEARVNKIIINKQDIENSGYTNLTDILKTISGLNVYQSLKRKLFVA